MGMATGDVSMVCSDDDRFSTIQGDAVNVAARLESSATNETVLVHSSAVALLGQAISTATVKLKVAQKLTRL